VIKLLEKEENRRDTIVPLTHHHILQALAHQVKNITIIKNRNLQAIHLHLPHIIKLQKVLTQMISSNNWLSVWNKSKSQMSQKLAT
jgi:hypothetical protein